jgi:Arc/MetJ-type ribon-helix-helix transcriptional regulator
MQLTISEQTRKLIEERLRSGQYESAEDVVAAAVAQMGQHDQLGDFSAGELDQLLAQGEESGAALDGDQVLSELRKASGQR